MVRAAVLQSEEMGLKPVISRSAVHLINKKRQHLRIGYYGGIPNKQYEYDHRNDAALYPTDEMVQKKLAGAPESLRQIRSWQIQYAGPAVIEAFRRRAVSTGKQGEQLYTHRKAAEPESAFRYGVSSDNKNRYIIGEERSFTHHSSSASRNRQGL